MSGRILVVDDQEDVRLALQTLLSRDGWDTEEAASGEEAIAHVGQAPDLDALVVDYRMPDIDGIEVTRRIRKAGFEQPIIICSAYLNREIEYQASGLKAHAVSKDDLGELRHTIRRNVRAHRPQQGKELADKREGRVLVKAAAEPGPRRRLRRYAGRVAIVSAAYFGTAKLGLALAHAEGSITAVWAPTGIALAALLVWGSRLWPAVALGAFLANSWTGVPLASVLGITAGNTLEALAGAYLLLRVARFDRTLESVRDVLALVVFGGVVSTMVSATVGMASLWVGGAISASDLVFDWRLWWLGDLGGNLVVAPLLLVLASPRALSPLRERPLEAGVSLALVAPLIILIFSQFPLPFLIWPVFIWAALRYRQLGAAATTLIAAGIAVAFTASGSGPFVRDSPDDGLLLSQAFMCVTSVTALLLAVVTNQRERAVALAQRARDGLEAKVRERTSELQRSHEELELARELAFLIAEAKDVDAALAVALRRICETTGWAMGQAWIASSAGSHLECSPAWHADPVGLKSFRNASERITFEPGAGLPGRTWSSKEPTWIEDVKSDLNFSRSAAAAEVGFGAGMAVPVLAGEQVAAVLEFFVFEPRERDKRLVHAVATAAAQLGSLILRKRTEGILRASEERFRAMAESAREAVVSASSSGEITYFNPAAERVFGYSAREALDKPLSTLMPERFRDAHKQGLKRFLSTGESRVIGRTVELAGKRRDGREFPLELSVSTWRLGEESMFTAILRDITERKHAEQELANSRSRLQAIFDHVPAALSLRGVDGCYQHVNSYVARALGSTP